MATGPRKSRTRKRAPAPVRASVPRKQHREGPVTYSATRARWFLDTGKEQAKERGLYQRDADPGQRATYLATKRAVRVSLLRENTKQLRDYFTGFDSSSGFALNKIEQWPAARVKKVEQYAEYLNHLLSQPSVRYLPRSAIQREVASTFTGQLLPNQKAYVVHVESTRDRFRITREGDIVIEREVGRPAMGGRMRKPLVVYDIYYLFVFYLGWRPATWDQLINATEDMLPFLPDDRESRYFLHSELHGSIGAGQPKKSLLMMVKRMANEYAMKKFADTIIGFRRAGSRGEADAIYAQKVSHSQARKEQRDKAWRALRARSARRFRK